MKKGCLGFLFFWSRKKGGVPKMENPPSPPPKPFVSESGEDGVGVGNIDDGTSGGTGGGIIGGPDPVWSSLPPRTLYWIRPDLVHPYSLDSEGIAVNLIDE